MIPGIVAGSLQNSAGPPTDPNFASVAMLLHMNGTNGSTTFTDSSSVGRTMTAVGNAQISTAQSKFGGASGLFDGSGDRVTTPYNANINLTSTNFTLEGWIRPSSMAASQAVFGNRATGGMLLYFPGSALTTLRFLAAVGGTSYNVTLSATTAVSAGTWYHFAVTRTSSVWRLFLNGNLEASVTPVAGSVSNLSSATPTLGADSDGTLSFNGHIDDFRITLMSRYTASFTPPAAQFPDS